MQKNNGKNDGKDNGSSFIPQKNLRKFMWMIFNIIYEHLYLQFDAQIDQQIAGYL